MQVQYICGGTNEAEALTSICEMSMAWTAIQGKCPDLEEDPDPIFNGNYQIGRDFYDEGEDEDIIEKDEATEGGNYGKGYIQNLEKKTLLFHPQFVLMSHPRLQLEQ